MGRTGWFGRGRRATRGPSPNIEGGARDVLVVTNAVDAISFDPAVAYEATSANLCMNCYEPLIRFDANDFTKPVPALASTWDISPDGLTYTFPLRAAKFSNGPR